MRKRGWLPSILLACGAALFALLGAEAAVRALWSPERPGVRRLSNSKARYGRAGSYELDCYPSNPNGDFDVDLRRPATQERYRALGFDDLAGALPKTPWCVEFRFNALEARGPEYGPRRKGAKRIVVLGDSFTEGQGVREADAYPAVMAARLEAQAPGRYEVLNFGRRGLDFPELYAHFERALALEPDLVVYGLCLNDGDRSREFAARWPELNDWILVRRPPVLLTRWSSYLLAFVRDRLETRRIATATTRWYRDIYSEANAAGWNRTRDYLRRMNQGMQARDGRLLVAVWPLLVGLEGDYPFRDAHRRLARTCERQHIARRDLLEVLQGRSSASLRAHAADWHPNALAQRLAGEDLAKAVRGLLEEQPGP